MGDLGTQDSIGLVIAAMRPKWRMRWRGGKRGAATSTGTMMGRSRENINLTRQQYCCDLQQGDSTTMATAFDYTWWVVVVPSSLALLAPPTFLSASRTFSCLPHIFTFPRLSPFPPFCSLAMQHQPNPTTTVYSLQYLRLLDLLHNERATEPHLRTEDPVEWLAWAHTVCWLIMSPFHCLSCLF